MKSVIITLLMFHCYQSVIAQKAFELIFGESETGDFIIHTLEHQDHYFSMGDRSISPGSIYRTILFYKIDYEGEIINEAVFPKADTVYGLYFGISKPNGNLLCFGTLGHDPNPLRARHTYVCEISPNLELVWEKTDSILEQHPHARHRLRNILITPDDELIIQGVVDTVIYGNDFFIFLARYDLEGNRLDYKSFINYVDNANGSLILNADSTGFYLLGQLEVKPVARTWIEFDFEFNYLGSGTMETIYPTYWAPVTARWLSNGNLVTANRWFDIESNHKGLEMRLYNADLQLLKSTVINHHDKKVIIPERRGMGFIGENNIWVATFEETPPGWAGTEDIRFLVFDNEINLKGSMVYEGDTRYWLFDLLATSDTGCLVSGIVAEYEGTNLTDNYIKKVRLEDVLTGIEDLERKTGQTVEIWPVPAGETLHVKSSQDSNLLIFNTAGEKISEHSIKEGYNIVTLKRFPPGMYLITIRQNGIIIESHKIIKQ